jgi:pyridoxine 5-phosphate synthase
LPHSVCLVPEKRQELTTEGGLDAKSQVTTLTPYISALKSKEIVVSLFIDADLEQVEAAAQSGAQAVEFHTGPFCHAYDNIRDQNIWKKEFDRLSQSIDLAISKKLMVNLGHGINYLNIEALRDIPHITHFSIGHSIVSRASLVGMERAVREMATKIG